MSYPKFKIRASSANKIMANGRGSDISAGAKTYCKTWLLDLMYGGVGMSHVDTKYTMKGNQVEDDNIAFLAKNWGFEFEKNEDSFSNEWATGTPDILLPKMVVDIKSSWDYTTFPMFYDKVPNKDYMMQLQTYMWLTERSSSKLVYVLNNTPEHLRRTEIDHIDYTAIPDEFRIKEFVVEYDESIITELQEKVEKCQQYINGIIRQMSWEKYFQ